jgi:hypothetical protein
MLTKRVQSAMLFDNGNLAVFDIHGQQISELQGQYSIEKHQRIMVEALDDCKVDGFEILPPGFMMTVHRFVRNLKAGGLSYEEMRGD